MGRFPTWRAHIFQMGGSTTNQICFVFVAPIPGMPEITWPNSNQNQGSCQCGGFKLFTAINLLGKMEIQLVENETQLETSHRFNFHFFVKKQQVAGYAEKKVPLFFQPSFTAFIWHWNMTTIKSYKIKRSKTKCQKRPVFYFFLLTMPSSPREKIST